MHRTRLPLYIALMLAASSLQAQAPTGAGQQVHANLNQLMRGALYPASNVVFSAQTDNPAEAKPISGEDPSMATDPLRSTFGGWVAVENAALTLAESANLLSIPGRTCANGVPVPITDPAWAPLVQQLRDASMQAYRAAQSKDQRRMIETADTLSAACAGCHRKWRDRRPADRRCR
jgi:hypothetical protein